MNKLTAANYYERNNKALTCSKIKDYALCPHYFYRKNVLNDIKEEGSDAFLIGGLVDKLISGEDFDTKYEVVERRTPKLKADAESRGVTLMLQSQLDEIIEIASAVEETDAWKYIKSKAQFQTILQIEMDINEHFTSLAGRPDFWWIEDVDGVKTCFIVDLKTAQTADHRKYYYHALGFKYDWQLANYKGLLKQLYPEIEAFNCSNLVVAKNKNIYNVELFEYPEHVINSATTKLNNVINLIAIDTDYRKYNPSFESPAIFGEFSDNDDIDFLGDEE